MAHPEKAFPVGLVWKPYVALLYKSNCKMFLWADLKDLKQQEGVKRPNYRNSASLVFTGIEIIMSSRPRLLASS